MEGYDRKRFAREFVDAMDQGVASLFCGAGTSIPAAMKDWRSLLRGIADDLDLKVEFVVDLVELAQFNFNERGTRNEIHRLIIDEFGRRAEPTKLHDQIVQLPIDTIWTTNYDRVIEDSYRSSGMRPDVKIRPENLAAHPRLWDVQIFKMHGDVGAPNDAVITKNDYEEYPLNVRGHAFLAALEVAMLSRTFLFLGFSFSDPNIDNVLGRLSVMHHKSQRTHYTVMKRPKDIRDESSDQEKHDFRIAELRMKDWKQRFSIETILVDDYDEIPDLLQDLVRASRKNHVFVSGAIEDYGRIERSRISELSDLLGRSLARGEKFLISGYGVNIGSDVLQGYFDEAYQHEARDLTDRAIVRPFPQRLPVDATSAAARWTRHRRDMISKAGFTIFMAGNKIVEGYAQRSTGMLEEFEIGLGYGVVPIPVGMTGDVAREIWERVMADVGAFYGSARVEGDLEILGRGESSNHEIVNAVFGIMDKVTHGG